MLTKTINSSPYTLSGYWSKLLRYGYLIHVLARRELRVKYANTWLGIGWFFLQPLAVVLIYSIFFKYLIHIQSDAIPYAPFVFSGLVLWYLFTGIVGKGTYALVESAELITKVPFPRIIVLLAKIIPTIVECLVLLLLLFIVMLGNHQPIGWQAFSALFYFIEITVFSFSMALLCSTVAVKHRDLAHIIPIAINFGIWLTPVFYPLSIIPAPYQNYVRYLNPLAAAIEGLRNSLFFSCGISAPAILIFVTSGVLLLLAFYYFVKFEKNIVENL